MGGLHVGRGRGRGAGQIGGVGLRAGHVRVHGQRVACKGWRGTSEGGRAACGVLHGLWGHDGDGALAARRSCSEANIWQDNCPSAGQDVKDVQTGF